MNYFDLLYILFLVVCVVLLIILFVVAVKDYKMTIKLYKSIKDKENLKDDKLPIKNLKKNNF